MKEKNREVQLRRYMRYDSGHVGETEGTQDSGGRGGEGSEENYTDFSISLWATRAINLRPSLSDRLVLAERER